jgi:hypothetical protein
MPFSSGAPAALTPVVGGGSNTSSSIRNVNSGIILLNYSFFIYLFIYCSVIITK